MSFTTRVGVCVYKDEVLELMKKLEAEGILLVVVNGKKNIDTYEISAAVQGKHVADVGQVLIKTGLGYLKQIEPYIDGSVVI